MVRVKAGAGRFGWKEQRKLVRWRSVASVGGAMLSLLVAFPVRAQPSTGQAAAPSVREGTRPGEAAAEVTPPMPVTTTLGYPEGAEGWAEVELEFTVDAAGKVRDVSVIEGEPPFDRVAAAAAAKWRFEPAERNGVPVPVRLRYRVEFEPPIAAAPEARTEASSSAPKAPGTPEPIDVLVEGQRRPPGSVRLSREEVRALPGAFGDPLRAIEAEPGVVPIVSGLPYFFIRGAPPANVGFFIDGVDVPLLYHAFFGPSVLHPAMIHDVELYAGGGPVQYGRFAGPIVVANTEPFADEWTGEASIRLIDAGALAEAPFGTCPEANPGCARGHVRVGGRYSYTGFILSRLSDAKLDYWDYQAQLSYPLGRRDTVGVFSFGAFDFFDAGEEFSQEGGRVQFHRVDLRWDHRPKPETRLRLALTGGFDRTAGEGASVEDQSLRLRSELAHDVETDFTLRAGFDVRIDHFDLVADPRFAVFADYTTLFPERTEGTLGGYVGASFRPTRRILVEPGVRADLYSSSGMNAVGVDPRIAALFELGPRVRTEHSLTIAHQLPNFVPQVPGARVSDLGGGLQQAVLWSSGVSMSAGEAFDASATVFRNAFFDALDPIGGTRTFRIDRTSLAHRSLISSAGLELKLSRPMTRKLGGFVAYTLSRAEFAGGSTESVSGFDRTHVAQVALSYDFGAGFRAGARALYYTGIPALDLRGVPHFVTDRRGSSYLRADARFEKFWPLGRTGRWGVIAEILNATGTKEVLRVDCGNVCRERVAGPVVLPSIGVEARL